jgi:superfamily II DNA or RNA helicase
MKIEINSTLRIHNAREFITELVAEELTIDNPKHKEAVDAGRSTWGIDPIIKNFSVDAFEVIHLPRGYKDRLLFLAEHNGIPVELIDQRTVVPIIGTHEHIIDLRDYQYSAVQELASYSEGTLISPAGSGKTIMGIALIVMSGQKVLWITHTKQLAHQFIERAKQFITNLSEDDIGHISSGVWHVGDKITVSLIRSKDKLKEISKDFGMVIVDECHHVPATTFSEVINNLNPYYLYGLTATPFRRDNLEKMLFQNIGPMRHAVARKSVALGNRIITPTVKVVRLNTNPLQGETHNEILKSLVENEERSNTIINDVLFESNLGNVCIVVTDRKAHAEILFNKLTKAGAKVGIATGAYNDKFRETTLLALENKEINVLVCTAALLGEGFDYAPLNRLFIGLPFRNAVKCEQFVGRVQRPCEGKTDSFIYDYVDDTHGLTRHQFKNSGNKGCRYNVYKKLGCIVVD